MLGILRSFAWMRWRVLVNSLELTGARDTLERFSAAIEQIGPLIAAVLFVPSAIGLAALAGLAGFTSASAPGGSVTLQVVRYLLLTALALCVAGPILLGGSERTNPTRLLLLPISHNVLYAAQAFSAIADPWILLVVPIVLAMPIGLAAGGAGTGAGVALVAGIILLAVFIGISSMTTAVLRLIVRDRRRGELLAVLFIVIFPIVLMLPGLLDTQERRIDPERGVRMTRIPQWAWTAGTVTYRALPSELYISSVSRPAGRPPGAAIPLLSLGAAMFVIHGPGLLVFRRSLSSPETSRSRGAPASAGGRTLTIPGISPAASAVALNQLRLALRTPRGRSTLLSPFVVFAMFALLLRQSAGAAEFGIIQLGSGFALATFAAAVCLLSTLPFATNQFAIDGAGLTLQLLSPLSNLEILIGKAVGNGLIACVPAIICMAMSYLFFPGNSPALWLSLPVGVVATYVLGAPGAAALSAIFPRAVNLNSIGSRSNAHGAAGLLGTLLFGLAALPPVLLVFLATAVLDRPALAPVFLLFWVGIALAVARLVFGAVGRLFQGRRENLALLV